MRHISVMQNFCNLVPQAFEAAFHTSNMVPEAPDDEEEGADVGAPLNESKLWARLARLRLVKAGVFFTGQVLPLVDSPMDRVDCASHEHSLCII